MLCRYSSAPAFGWGCEGHQMIALIARAHLTPAASAAVDQLLSANPIDPALSRFCNDRPADLMADSATWADDERNIDKTTAGWHFIDIPLAVQRRIVPVPLRCGCDEMVPAAGPRRQRPDRLRRHRASIMNGQSSGMPTMLRRGAGAGAAVSDSLSGRPFPAAACLRQSRSGRQLHEHRFFCGAEAA